MKGDRFERLEQLRKEAAERLRLPVEHDKVQLLAALRLNHETLVEKLVAGNSVNPDQLLALSEAIDKLTPELPPQKITVEFVEGPIERCPAWAGVVTIKCRPRKSRLISRRRRYRRRR